MRLERLNRDIWLSSDLLWELGHGKIAHIVIVGGNLTTVVIKRNKVKPSTRSMEYVDEDEL
jgi:hypothetical protein